MKLVATCFTEKHGIHKIQVNADSDGNLPDFLAVEVPNMNNDLKFDPRKEDWDAWVQSPMGQIPCTVVATKRLIGTIYMENLPINRIQPKTNNHLFMTKYKFGAHYQNGTHGDVTIGKL